MKAALYAIGLALTLALPAGAATISGTGNPGSAVASATVETFDTTTAGLYNSLTFGNVTISSVGDPYTVGPDFNGDFNTSGGQSIYNDFDESPLNFRFDFATAVQAFAFNWGAADVNWTLSAYDAANNLLESFVLAPTFGSNAGDYYGIAAAGISYATLVTNVGDFVFIDNFASTATVAPVPLPAALPLLLGALGGLAFVRRRRA